MEKKSLLVSSGTGSIRDFAELFSFSFHAHSTTHHHTRFASAALRLEKIDLKTFGIKFKNDVTSLNLFFGENRLCKGIGSENDGDSSHETIKFFYRYV